MRISPRFLMGRLMFRGIPLSRISRLVRNVLNVIGDGGFFTTELVNQQQTWVSYCPPVFLSDKGDLIIYPTSVLLVAVDNYCFGVYVSGDSHINSIWMGCLILSYGVDSGVHLPGTGRWH